jgi:hypothetical protein
LKRRIESSLRAAKLRTHYPKDVAEPLNRRTLLAATRISNKKNDGRICPFKRDRF